MTAIARAAPVAIATRASGEEVIATKCHGCWFPPDGAHVAASMHLASRLSSTGSSVNRRIALAVRIVSHSPGSVIRAVSPPLPRTPESWLKLGLGDAAERDQPRGHAD